MKKIKFIAMLLSLACAAGFTSCDSDDDIKAALERPTVTQDATAYNSLSFSWNKIANAVQYGYRLVDPNGSAVNSGVTQATSVKFTSLQPSTTYTLNVWAFSAMDGDYSTPPAVTLTATTDGLTPLAAPEVTLAASERLEASWERVTGAKQYSYTVTKDGALVVSDVTSSTSFTQVLPAGTYSVSVVALANGKYSNSPAGTATTTLNVTELYTVTGQYYSAALGKAWEAKMTAYSNGAYTIFNFYGVNGYNLEFANTPSNRNNKFSFLNGEEVNDEVAGYKTWQIPTGSWLYPTLIAYPWDNYCSVAGDSESGEISIGNYYGPDYANWGSDTFVWPAPSDDDPFAKITGTFTNHFVGWSSLENDNYDWEQIDANNWTATIKKIDDETLEIDGLYWKDTPVYGVLDLEAGTITIEAQEYGDSWYTFASTSGGTDSVVATINEDGSITFPNICLWYDFGDGDWWYYMYGTSTLTK